MEIQIRRWGSTPSIEITWAEGYTVEDGFVPREMRRDQIPDAGALLAQAGDSKVPIGDALTKSLLQWLVTEGKVAGTIS